MRPINVNFEDRSRTEKELTGTVAGTVIKNHRGSSKPILFFPNQEKRITDILGIPSDLNPAVMDIIEYNRSYPIWVSCPSNLSKYGGVFITSLGCIPFSSGFSSKTVDFANVVSSVEIGVGNGVLTNFEYTIANFSRYKNNSLMMLINGVPVPGFAGTNVAVEVISTTPSIGGGTYDRSNGSLDFTFTTPPLVGDVITIEFTEDYSTIAYGALFNKNPQADDLSVKVVKVDSDISVELKKFNTRNSTYDTVSGFPKIVSLVKDKKNGRGQNIWMPVVLKTDDLVEFVSNPSLAYTTTVDSTVDVLFKGGKRGVTTSVDIVAGWEHFKDSVNYRASIMFDTTSYPSVLDSFKSLRKNSQKYSDYLYPCGVVDAATIATTFGVTKPDSRGIKVIANAGGIINNKFTGSEINVSLMGRIALRYADIANDAFRGLAPAWYNAAGKWGGQIGYDIISLNYNYDDNEQEQLKALKVNPVIIDKGFGAVIVSHLTSQIIDSDYSYQAHSGLADYIVENVVERIMPYQLSKPNDDFHRTQIKSLIDNLLSKVSQVGNSRLLDYFEVVCDGDNNGDEVRSRREFVCDIIVRFTPTSETITINFINDAQGKTSVVGA